MPRFRLDVPLFAQPKSTKRTPRSGLAVKDKGSESSNGLLRAANAAVATQCLCSILFWSGCVPPMRRASRIPELLRHAPQLCCVVVKCKRPEERSRRTNRIVGTIVGRVSQKAYKAKGVICDVLARAEAPRVRSQWAEWIPGEAKRDALYGLAVQEMTSKSRSQLLGHLTNGGRCLVSWPGP